MTELPSLSNMGAATSLKAGRQSLSVGIKVTLIVTTFALALLALVSAIGMYRIKADMKALLGEQQLTLVSRVAEDIDEKLLTAQTALTAVSRVLRPELVGDPERLEADLTNRPGFLSLFDGMFVISSDGITLVDVPRAGLRGASVVDREFFQKSLATRAPYISEPFVTRNRKLPLVVITAPILDAHGKVAGILVGSLNLLRPNFLGRLGDAKLGKTGSFALFTRTRTIIASRDKEQIMTRGPAPGVAPYFDHASAGQQGWEEDTNDGGPHALYSYAPLRAVPWVLVAALPIDEAYAPIEATQRHIAIIAAALAALLMPLVWFGMQRLLVPLVELRRDIRNMREDLEGPPETAKSAGDEIRALVNDFRLMTRERGESDAELRASEEHLNAVLDSLPALIAQIDDKRRLRYVNRAFAQWFGGSALSFWGRPVAEVIQSGGGRQIEDLFIRALAGESLRQTITLSRAGIDIEIDARFVPDEPESGRVAGCYIMLTEVAAPRQQAAAAGDVRD
jgi:PAS domain-containing protein